MFIFSSVPHDKGPAEPSRGVNQHAVTHTMCMKLLGGLNSASLPCTTAGEVKSLGLVNHLPLSSDQNDPNVRFERTTAKKFKLSLFPFTYCAQSYTYLKSLHKTKFKYIFYILSLLEHLNMAATEGITLA